MRQNGQGINRYGKIVNNVFFITLITQIFYTTAMSNIINDEIISPVGILKETILTKDIVFNNSSEIYYHVIKLLDHKKSVVYRQYESWPSTIACIAWRNNPVADIQHDKIQLSKGISIFEAIKQIAKKRNEVLNESRNFIIIRSPNQNSLRFSYKKQTNNFQNNDSINQIEAVMRTELAIIQGQANSEMLEILINERLKESRERSTFKARSDLIFKIDKTAKKNIDGLNIMGRWVYEDLLDAICALTGLRWKIDGNIIWLTATNSRKDAKFLQGGGAS
jgi:hypothetical protein